MQSEQRHASANDTIPADVRAEIDRLAAADFVILQYPMWWHLPPAILKGWMVVCSSTVKLIKAIFVFKKGQLVGKKAMISTTVSTSPENYAHDGRSGDIDMMLWPINFSLAYVGFNVLAPHVAYGTEASLRYSGPQEITNRLKKIELDYVARLQAIEAEPSLPFNRMEDWGADAPY